MAVAALVISTLALIVSVYANAVVRDRRRHGHIPSAPFRPRDWRRPPEWTDANE